MLGTVSTTELSVFFFDVEHGLLHVYAPHFREIATNKICPARLILRTSLHVKNVRASPVRIPLRMLRYMCCSMPEALHASVTGSVGCSVAQELAVQHCLHASQRRAYVP